MICSSIDSGRRATTISVILLGGAICTLLMAYAAFGDSNEEHELKTLKQVSIIFRHGDKSPTELYPNDPHKNYEWPGGYGALSEKGTLQLYNLGKILRMRYYRLLPQNGLYSKDEMTVISSAAERCIMSAQSLLAGLLPPLDKKNILPIMWQPVPVNTIPRNEDKILAQTKPCRKYADILKKQYINPPPDIREMNEQNEELYSYLTLHTGKNISTILDVELLYNTLEIEENAGLILPSWTEDVFPDKMLPLAERSYTLFTETALMKKVKGGFPLTIIQDNMVNKREGYLKPDRKIFLYAGHDVTLVNIMNSMGIISQTSRRPEYGSALVFELHSSSIYVDDFEVKIVYYFNSDDQFPKVLDIPNCSAPCSLTDFSNSIKHLLLTDYEGICA